MLSSMMRNYCGQDIKICVDLLDGLMYSEGKAFQRFQPELMPPLYQMHLGRYSWFCLQDTWSSSLTMQILVVCEQIHKQVHIILLQTDEFSRLGAPLWRSRMEITLITLIHGDFRCGPAFVVWFMKNSINIASTQITTAYQPDRWTDRENESVFGAYLRMCMDYCNNCRVAGNC